MFIHGFMYWFQAILQGCALTQLSLDWWTLNRSGCLTSIKSFSKRASNNEIYFFIVKLSIRGTRSRFYSFASQSVTSSAVHVEKSATKDYRLGHFHKLHHCHIQVPIVQFYTILKGANTPQAEMLSILITCKREVTKHNSGIYKSASIISLITLSRPVTSTVSFIFYLQLHNFQRIIARKQNKINARRASRREKCQFLLCHDSTRNN